MTDIDEKNLEYARRRIQLARYALAGEYQKMRQVLDYLDREEEKR